MELNAPQKKAVETVSGPLLVLAGAGTGKTKVITNRIFHMIFSCGIKPKNIVALSFTNKAALEMKLRISEQLGKEMSSELILSTFHSFALSILKEFSSCLNLNPNFKLCSEQDSFLHLQQSLKALKLEELYSADLAKQKISQLKDECYGFLTLQGNKYIFDLAILKPLFDDYNARLKLNNLIDFDDIVFYCNKILFEFKNIREILIERHTHFLVDEFQDTSIGQFEFIKMLCSKNKNVCVVGDDDQSIYSWRGASSASIQKFLDYFSNSIKISLEQNYRCSPNILEAANAIIEKNTQRQSKTLWSLNKNIHKIEIYKASNPREESEFISQKILLLKSSQKNLTWNSFAILFRNNSQCYEIESQLTLSGIPFKKSDANDDFDLPEKRDIKNFLLSFAFPNKLDSIFKVIHFSNRNIQVEDLNYFKEKSEEFGIGPHLFQKFKFAKEIFDFYSFWLEFYPKIILAPECSDVIIELKLFLKKIQYEKEVASRSSSMRLYKEKMEQIDVFLNLMSRASNPKLKTQPAHTTKFKNEKLSSALDTIVNSFCVEYQKNYYPTQKENNDAVELLTIHAAKGLEFENVFIVGAEEKILPHEKTLLQSLQENNNVGLEEERRLCYVAVTRAKQRLFISYCEERFQAGKQSKNRATEMSRFIKDIPQHLLNFQEPIESSEGARKAELSGKLFDMFR
jgi:superfamily I DNA/RNA helicase